MRNLLLIVCFTVLASFERKGSTGSSVTEKEAKTALEFHNKIRKEVGVPPLQWSATLAAYAQQWANHLAENDCSFQHRPHAGEWRQQYGENLFWGSSTQYTVINACESWYQEKSAFTGPTFTGDESPVVGHYTQMVWRNTKNVGIGAAHCKDGGIIIVANYDPPGNYIGQKPY